MNAFPHITAMDWIVLSLATFRLVRLIVYDEIFAWFRNLFHKTVSSRDDHQNLVEHIIIKGSGLRYAVGYLLTCHWCTGIWISGFVVTIYIVLPNTFPILLGLSIAGMSSILQSFINEE